MKPRAIYFEIKGNPVTKKNSSRIVGLGKKCPFCGKSAKQIVIPSKQYEQYEKDCKNYMPKLPEPISERANIKALYYMQTHRKVDLVNLSEALCDILVKYKVLADDNSNIVASMDGSQVLYDKNNPRTEVWIERLDDT